MRRLVTLSTFALVLVVGACAEREPTAFSPAEFKKEAPPADADLVALGKAIFVDENLSIGANQSCATCHDPNWGWTGPNSTVNAGGAVYEGSVPGAFGDRKPNLSRLAKTFRELRTLQSHRAPLGAVPLYQRGAPPPGLRRK